MKRSLAAPLIAAALVASAGRAQASTSAMGQIQWTSGATQTMAIVTQYNAAFAQGNALPPLLPSIAGVCTPAGTESNFTVSFGALAPRPNAATACLYKNALAVRIQSNDSTGFVINEYLDATPTPGIGICAFPNGGGAFPLAPTLGLSTSARGGNPAAGTFAGMNLTSCAAGGSIVPPGTGGASTGGTTPGNVGTPSLEYYAPSGTALAFLSSATTTVNGGAIVSMYGGEDIQVNLAPGATSTTAGQFGVYLTVQLVPN